jgi:hypothetical protein
VAKEEIERKIRLLDLKKRPLLETVKLRAVKILLRLLETK